MSTLSLVTCSGPTREQGIARLLHSVCLRPQGSYVERAVIGWPAGHEPPAEIPGGPYPIPVRWAREFLPKQLVSLAKSEAKEHGHALWMRDDEVLVPDDDPLHAAVGEVFKSNPTPLPYPLSKSLEKHPYEGVSLVFRYPRGSIGAEPRIIGGKFNPPFYFTPSNRHLGTPSWHMPEHPILLGLLIQQERFPAPTGAPLRLNIGAGARTFSTWTSVDRDPGDVPDHLLDISREPLPFKDGSTHAIYMSHVLDHFNFFEGEHVLKECRRVLRPGGVLRVAVCNLGEFMRRYKDGGLEDFAYFQPLVYRELKSPGLRFGLVACGGSSDKAEWYSGHRMLYDEGGLHEMLQRAGFGILDTCDADHVHPQFWDLDEPYPDHTLFVEATAP